MNKKRLTDQFCKLVSIDSPSLKERSMADFIKGELKSLGVELQEDDSEEKTGGNCPNLYGFWKGSLAGEPILFSMHMDTVAPAVGKRAVVHSDGRITSDGTTVLGADDLSAVAAVLEAVRNIREEGLHHRDIEFAFSVGEELHLKGSRSMDFSRFKSREAYVLDLCGEPGTAAVKAPSLGVFQAKIIGKASHAGFAPQQGVHAIKIASSSITRLEMGHVGDDMTVNVGSIHGGEVTNIVPDSCIVTGEVRSLTHANVMAQLKKIGDTFREEAYALGGEVEFREELLFHAYATEETDPVVKRFQKVCRKMQLPCQLTNTFGGSDLNCFAQHRVHGMVLASAMYQVHSCEEYTTVEAMAQVSEIVKRLMVSGE